MSDNGNITKFEPADYLQQIDGKPYLNPRKATTWFYHDHPAPSGKIITNVVRMEPTILVRAEVWIDGEMVATGHADPDGKSNTLKKIESSAIRRALANAGYGTDQVVSHISKSIGLEDGKNMLGSGKATGERRMGAAPAGGHKVADLEAWALINIYDRNEFEMKNSFKKLVAAGKLNSSLTLEEAKNVVRDRHAEEKTSEQIQQTG